jgi:chemotaxis protein CheX
MNHSFTHSPPYDPECPYSSLLREDDRAVVLHELIVDIWKTALDLPLSRVDEAPDEPGLKTCTAVVHLTGAFRGSVALTAAVPLAAECAARMFQSAIDKLSPAEVQDSWGELSNMVAGNLKALVSKPTVISLPTVMEGTTYTFRVPRASPINELTYACLGHRMRVTVQRAESESQPALAAATK